MTKESSLPPKTIIGGKQGSWLHCSVWTCSKQKSDPKITGLNRFLIPPSHSAEQKHWERGTSMALLSSSQIQDAYTQGVRGLVVSGPRVVVRIGCVAARVVVRVVVVRVVEMVVLELVVDSDVVGRVATGLVTAVVLTVEVAIVVNCGYFVVDGVDMTRDFD